jgi:Fe-S cluster assembly protein SufD
MKQFVSQTETSDSIDLSQILQVDLSNHLYWTFHNGRCKHLSDHPSVTFKEEHDSYIFKLDGNENATLIFIHKIEKSDSELENHTRTVVTLGFDAVFSLIELYIADDNFEGMNHATTEINLQDGAQLKHIQIKMGNHKGKQTLCNEIKQKANSLYQASSYAFHLLEEKTRFNIALTQKNAQCSIQQLISLKNQEKANVTITMHHLHSDCESNIIVRGVIHDQAKGEFIGKIIIEEGAHHSLAHLENKNLLVSETAEMITRPQLEVYNDDVKCSHGATVGHLDEDALFYLTSRGIPLPEAKQLLIEAFITPVLKDLPEFLLNLVRESLYGDS